MDLPASVTRNCGRATRAGTPCRNQLSQFDIACRTHATEHERELAEARRSGWSVGFKAGHEAGDRGARGHVEHLEQRIRELEQKLDAAARVHRLDSDQVVEVNGYAYLWRGGTPLEVGDQVLVPENWLDRMKKGPGPTEDTVTALGSTYRGELASIIRKLTDA